MKKLSFVLYVVAALVLLLGGASGAMAQGPGAHALSAPAAFPTHLTITLTTPPLTWSRDPDGFDVPAIAGQPLSGAPGDPNLPTRVVTLAVPPDVWWPSLKVEVVDAQVSDLPGTYTLAPAPPLVFRHEGHERLEWGSNAATIVDGRNVQVYAADAYFPASPVLSWSPSQTRRWRLLHVRVAPLQINPVTGRARLATEITLQVSWERDARAAESPGWAAELADGALDELVEPTLANLDQARAWYPPAASNQQAAAEYVIITSNAVYAGAGASLNAFASHKQARGHTVQIVTDNDYGSLPGDPPHGTAEKIRQWLRDNYVAKGIRYVLLVGDPTPATGDVPMKMTHYRGTPTGDPCYDEQPTDAYYSDLGGNWDLNGDGIFGQGASWPAGDRGTDGSGHLGANLSPEVYVGRIPVYRGVTGWADTLRSILQKMTNYQNASDIAWRWNALLPMSFLRDDTDGAYLAEAMKADYLSSRGYSTYTLYQHQAGCNSIFPSDQDLTDGAVREYWKNHPFGLVTWSAHGAAQGASIGCSGGTLLATACTQALDDRYPAVVMQTSCDNGYPGDPDNLGYALLRRGAIATVSASRCTGFYPGNFSPSASRGDTTEFGYEFADQVTGPTPGEFGVALAAVKASFDARSPAGPHALGWAHGLLFNLYGDPEMRIVDAASTGRLTIPAAAFQPWTDGYDAENHGRYLIHHGPGSGVYLASVQLPHGATVTKMTFHFYDSVNMVEVESWLQRTDLAGNYVDMAYVASQISGGYWSWSTTSIAYPTIDNAHYAYHAVWRLPATTNLLRGCAVIIEYNCPAAAPGTDYLSLSAAAFSSPFEDGYDYDNHGRYLYHFHSPGGGAADGWYYAPVYLPDGATVTKMKFYWYDQRSGAHGLAKLQRTRLGQGNWEDLASVNTWAIPGGFWDSETTSITGATIDNSQYAYWLIWVLPVSTGASHPGVDDLMGCGVVLEYNRPSAGTGVGRISMPAAAFGTAFEDGYDFQNHGRFLLHLHSPGGGTANGWYLAPVSLPSGATVTKMTFYFKDTWAIGGMDGLAKLQRTRLGEDNWADMASVASSGSASGYQSKSTTAINYAAIDNASYAYWVIWDIPYTYSELSRFEGCGVVIEYGFRLYLPLVLRSYSS